jgi:hypothetical protein
LASDLELVKEFSLQLHKSPSDVMIFVLETCHLVWYLALAWNLEVRMKLGHFGLATVDSKALMSGKGIQTKDHTMARLHHANLFVQMRVIDCRTKEII